MAKVLSVILGLILAVSGVLFRSFWLSEWGLLTFIFPSWLTISVTTGWGGKGKPHSISFGLICGSGIVIGLLAVFFINIYVGMGVLLALAYLALKTKFFERGNEQLRTHLPKFIDRCWRKAVFPAAHSQSSTVMVGKTTMVVVGPVSMISEDRD